jgi:hypothetical protein
VDSVHKRQNLLFGKWINLRTGICFYNIEPGKRAKSRQNAPLVSLHDKAREPERLPAFASKHSAGVQVAGNAGSSMGQFVVTKDHAAALKLTAVV